MNVWANVVTALILSLSPTGGLTYQDPGADGEQSGGEDELAELVDDLGGVYCGVYEPCRHGEAASIFVNLVNSTGTKHSTYSTLALVLPMYVYHTVCSGITHRCSQA